MQHYKFRAQDDNASNRNALAPAIGKLTATTMAEPAQLIMRIY
jgi:hypothetical protein